MCEFEYWLRNNETRGDCAGYMDRGVSCGHRQLYSRLWLTDCDAVDGQGVGNCWKRNRMVEFYSILLGRHKLSAYYAHRPALRPHPVSKCPERQFCAFPVPVNGGRCVCRPLTGTTDGRTVRNQMPEE